MLKSGLTYVEPQPASHTKVDPSFLRPSQASSRIAEKNALSSSADEMHGMRRPAPSHALLHSSQVRFIFVQTKSSEHAVGASVGSGVGSDVGRGVGVTVGPGVGSGVGRGAGAAVGAADG